MRATAILAMTCFLAGAALAGQPPVDYKGPPPNPPGTGKFLRPVPGQLPGVVPPPLPGVGPYQRLPMIDETPYVVIAVRNEPYWKAGVADPVLTDACRLGDFASIALNRMVERFTAPQGVAVLEVVLPDRRNLLRDSRHLARPGEIYYFLDARSPDCQVWVEHLVKPRKLNAGTSLPPADPRALKKKLAQINGWPKN